MHNRPTRNPCQLSVAVNGEGLKFSDYDYHRLRVACGVDICIFLTRYGVDIDIDEVSESLNSDPRLHRMWINNNMQIIYDMLERSRKFKR